MAPGAARSWPPRRGAARSPTDVPARSWLALDQAELFFRVPLVLLAGIFQSPEITGRNKDSPADFDARYHTGANPRVDGFSLNSELFCGLVHRISGAAGLSVALGVTGGLFHNLDPSGVAVLRPTMWHFRLDPRKEIPHILHYNKFSGKYLAMPRLGRPKKDEASKRTAQLSIRIPASLRARLEAACQQSETTHSLSTEIELRLRRSFEDPEQPVKDRFGGPTSYWLFLVIANQVRTLERFTEGRWWRDPYTHWQMKVLINTMLDCFKPFGRARTPRKFMSMGEPLGQHLARREFANIEATLLDSDPPIAGNWGGMTITEWRQAAELFKDKLKQSPLAQLYGIERTKK